MPIIRNKTRKLVKQQQTEIGLDRRWKDGLTVGQNYEIDNRFVFWSQSKPVSNNENSRCPLREFFGALLKQLPGFPENRERAKKVCGSTAVCQVCKWPWGLRCANLWRLWRVSDGQDSDCATDGSPKRREDTPGSQASNDPSFVSGSWMAWRNSLRVWTCSNIIDMLETMFFHRKYDRANVVGTYHV